MVMFCDVLYVRVICLVVRGCAVFVVRGCAVSRRHMFATVMCLVLLMCTLTI